MGVWVGARAGVGLWVGVKVRARLNRARGARHLDTHLSGRTGVAWTQSASSTWRTMAVVRKGGGSSAWGVMVRAKALTGEAIVPGFASPRCLVSQMSSGLRCAPLTPPWQQLRMLALLKTAQGA